MSWTDERIDRLKKMWSDGATASQIADELGGVSRNAVIGKAHRLGLDARPSPVKAADEKEKKAAPAKAAPRAESSKRAPANATGETDSDSPAPHPRTPQRPQPDGIQYRSIGPGGFVRQGPGDTQAPI